MRHGKRAQRPFGWGDHRFTLVLNAVPEGWAAALLSNKLKPEELEILNLRPGEVREITNPSDPIKSR